MLYLPNRIEIQLDSDVPEVVCGVLVAIHFSIDERYYYGTLVGLTDVNGVARVTREKIEQDFSEDQRFFLMDSKVPLRKCDPVAVIHIEGGEGFIERRSGIDSPHIAATARELWLAATNENIQTECASVDLRKSDRNWVVRSRIRIRKRSV